MASSAYHIYASCYLAFEFAEEYAYAGLGFELLDQDIVWGDIADYRRTPC